MMKAKVVKALMEMGMPAKISGFQYIQEAICMFDKEKEWRTTKITALYHAIARKHKKTDHAVERAIRFAFQSVLKKGDREKVEKYLTFQNTTNTNLLATLYLRLSGNAKE